MTARCPLHRGMTDEPHECHEECAWLMTDYDEPGMHACAVAVIASRIGEQADGSANTYVIENEVSS